MKRVVNIAKDHEEAYRWDIKQAIEMSAEERQQVAGILKRKVYGSQPDIRAYHKNESK